MATARMKLWVCFAVFVLVAEIAPLSFSSSLIKVGNAGLVAGAVPTFTFGNSAVGSYLDQNDPNAKSASSFTCGGYGQITDIYAYVARADSAGTARAALYADDSGQPGSLMAQSNPESVSTSFSWVDFQLLEPASVTSGTVYWLGVCSDDLLNLYVVAGTGERVHNGNLYSEGFSDPFSSVWGTSSAGGMSIYASGGPVSSELSVEISPISANIALGGFQEFTSNVTGGALPRSYQWYLNGSAELGANSQDWFFGPSAVGHYNTYLNVTDAFGNEAQSNIVSNVTVSPSLYSFSIMQITDTQFLSSTYPDLYDQLATWIVNNNATYNLKMVVHTGDIVDQYDDTAQWQNANSAMAILTNGGIPYTWDAGNHDQIDMNDPNSGWIGNQYASFNPANFRGNSYWVGDSVQGKNTAVKFSFGGYNFLVINLECEANATAMAWATNLLNTYSSLNYNIIVATHAYLASPNTDFNNDLSYSPTWEQNLQTLLNNYPRVFLTLNGHTSIDPAVNVRNVVNGRTQIEFNDQYNNNDQGAGSVRIYSFYLNNQTVAVSTSSVWDSTWLTESQDSFSFSTNLISVPSVSVSPTVVRLDLGQSQVFSSSVTAGKSPYSYQWYLNDSAVSGATNQTWTFTPSAAGNYKVYVNVTDSNNIKVQSNNVTDFIVYPQLTTSIAPITVNMTVGTTQPFTSLVTGGLAPYTYQWTLNDTTVSGATAGNWNFMPAASGHYKVYLNVTDAINAKVQSYIVTDITVNPALMVTIVPSVINMTTGSSQTFNSTLGGGTAPYFYQWYSNSTIIPGAYSSSYIFVPASAGTYNIYLNITDKSAVTVKSNVVTARVETPMTVNVTPTQVEVYVGKPQKFNSFVSGGTPLYLYQWYLNDTAVLGAVSQNWTFTPTTAGHYKVYLEVTDALGFEVQSNFVTNVTVFSQPTVSISPIPSNMTVGSEQQLTVIVSGGAQPFSYQWYLNSSAVLGANSSSWTFQPTTNGTYNIYLIATDNGSVSAQSNIAVIMVETPPNVTVSPTHVQIYLGQSQTFNPTVFNGTAPYSYQWYLNDTVVFGATSQTWMFMPTIAGNYRVFVEVTDALGIKVQSSVDANVTVYSSLAFSISPTSLNMTVGVPQTFSSLVSGGAQPYAYQWYLNGSQVSGANSSSWTFTPTITGNFIVYLMVSDSYTASGQSNSANVTVGEATFSVAGFVLQSGGSGYTTPAIILSGGGGTGAAATARVSNGVILGIVLTNPGSGYISAPTVYIRDPSPRAKGAAATAVLASS